ncbi:hypothetical protein [Rhizobium sp. ZW T2_16]|uniref:hypothetical protein n=1 Tax=Rhizobium sp. ZW T2_16 TaxID=3378083 RepID=UPI003855194E
MPDINLNLADFYCRRVERQSDILSDPDGGRQAAEALRSLIREIVLTPRAEGTQRQPGLMAEVEACLRKQYSRNKIDPPRESPIGAIRSEKYYVLSCLSAGTSALTISQKFSFRWPKIPVHLNLHAEG